MAHFQFKTEEFSDREYSIAPSVSEVLMGNYRTQPAHPTVPSGKHECRDYDLHRTWGDKFSNPSNADCQIAD